MFWLQSILWSDHPIITAKRLFKDLGEVAMILVMLTDQNSVQAVKAVCARCAYIGIPLSLVLIRYFPGFGRAFTGYNQDQLSFVGITANKNTLGMLTLVAAIFILWDCLDSRRRASRPTAFLSMGARVAVLLTAWYLLVISDSKTSLACAVIGSALALALDLPALKRRQARMEVWGVSTAVTLWALNSGLGLHKAFIESLGRDMSLTTRTDMWPVVLGLQDSPLLGAGFSTFWSGRRRVQIEQTFGDVVTQTHNGYLETYLNGGLIGVGLLIVLLCVSYWRIRERLALGAPDAGFRLSILFVAIVHNCTEATFYKLSLLWFLTVYAIMDYRISNDRSEAPGAQAGSRALHA